MPRIPRPGRRSPDEPVDPPANAATESQSTPDTTNGEAANGVAVAAGLPAGGEGDSTATSEEEKPTPDATPPPAEPPTAAVAAPSGDGGEAPGAAGSEDGAAPAGQEPASPDAGFGHRGQLRRRLRFLRRARELGLRDLGGLVFDMQRFGRPREDLVAGKVATLTRIDGELRSLEAALNDVQPVTVLREPGIAACPVCSAINATDANFCSNCGMPLSKRRGQEPVAAPRFGSDATPPALGAPAGGSAETPPAAGPAAAGAAGAPSPGVAPEAPTATFAATPAPVGPASGEKPDDAKPEGETPGEAPGQAPPEPSSS